MISIIIPNYNKAKYISKTINSLKSQIFQNWECIIIDDFSNDESIDIINKSTINDNRFVVFKNDKNRGACYSRNYGLNKAQGDFVMFLDSDDILSSNCLLERKDVFNHNVNFDFLVFPIGSFYKKIGDSKYVWNNFSGDHLKRFLSHDLPWAICSVLWKKSFLNKMGGFNESLVRLQDVDLHTKALLKKNINYKTFPNRDPDCFYRINYERVRNYNDFALNDVKGKIQYISIYSNIDALNEKYLKGTFFECFNLPILFYRKGFINFNYLKYLIQYILENSDGVNLNYIDLIIIKLYIKIRTIGLYFRGCNRLFKLILIR